MIALFTDFGSQDPYVGQIHAVLAHHARGIPVVDLFNDVPGYDIRAGAYLLPALVSAFPEETVFICVVDPGVGSPRRPLYMRLDNSWFVGPDNGLFQILVRRATQHLCYAIDWQPDTLSSSFHGRDLFAPVAAMLACGQQPQATATELSPCRDSHWPDDLAQIIYVDHFGNAISGYRANRLSTNAKLEVDGHVISRAITYSDVEKGQAFWYENSNGLAEFAVNQGSAAEQLALSIGKIFSVVS